VLVDKRERPPLALGRPHRHVELDGIRTRTQRKTTLLRGLTCARMTADIDRNLKTYLSARAPEARYASFDYCYNHFQEAREAKRVGQLADEDDRMLSCLQLGFYLASWGMM
jgi:hypothetical protein